MEWEIDMTLHMLGIDIAKSAFQLYGADYSGVSSFAPEGWVGIGSASVALPRPIGTPVTILQLATHLLLQKNRNALPLPK